MKRTLFIIGFILSTLTGFSQDLNCTVEVLTSQVQRSDKTIFEDMKNSITQFMNNRRWTNDDIQPNEKIDCIFQFQITKDGIDEFEATLNIQSSRPVYGSSYNTQLFRYSDRQVKFKYVQFQNLEFQENSYQGNLTSLLAFYAYLIIGLDYDSFALKGGDPYFKKAQQVRISAQNIRGWGPNDGNGTQNRYYLIENMLDPRLQDLRIASYIYHIKGLDVMHKDIEEGREQVYEALQNVKKVYEQLPNSFVLRLFFNAKRDELISIFKNASPSKKNKAVELLGKMDIANKSKYEDGILGN